MKGVPHLKEVLGGESGPSLERGPLFKRGLWS